MPNLETSPAAPEVPQSAYRATRYADWRDSVFCTVSANRYVCQRRSDAQRRRALAAFTLALVPHWTICDVGDRGASAYREAQSAPAAYSPFGAMVLDAASRLRRWRYYDAPEVPPAAPRQPLDGCHCHTCVLRE